MRISKYISMSGYMARRPAEKLITEGLVCVNGKVVTELFTQIQLEDKVEVEGKLLKLESTPRVWVYYKPAGYITSHGDPLQRPTIFDVLPQEFSNKITIGRLDMYSEGLLLLTNSGDLSNYLLSAKNGIKRKYQIRAFGVIDGLKVLEAQKGLKIEGEKYNPCIIEVIKQTKHNSWLEITLFEGKNREVRNIMRFLDLQVSKLIRVEFGAFKLNNLNVNEIKEIPHKMWRTYYPNLPI